MNGCAELSFDTGIGEILTLFVNSLPLSCCLSSLPPCLFGPLLGTAPVGGPDLAIAVFLLFLY